MPEELPLRCYNLRVSAGENPCLSAMLPKAYDAFRINVFSIPRGARRSSMSRTREVRTMPFSGW